MNKQDLLNAIKNEETTLDEREKEMKYKSFVKGYEGWYMALLALILIRSFTEDKFYMDLGMIISGQAIFMSYYLFKEGRNRKLNAILTIVMSVLFVVFTVLTLGYYEFI